MFTNIDELQLLLFFCFSDRGVDMMDIEYEQDQHLDSDEETTSSNKHQQEDIR